ncbi:FtsB family cell division protein [Acetilactobacillus jinshanensis]|uniref:Septum formation initiator family protein n=1 Tax=Acetilactobacillus jinshanensis TaxID=1720083 RepID=A0A4V1ALV0_9LACO|nr:septum formation initiator family protein [Acetilactobacillus jinshanensis]QBP18869.1 septum formation initiator family protein [Acetilactobacillus jinshanensis]
MWDPDAFERDQQHVKHVRQILRHRHHLREIIIIVIMITVILVLGLQLFHANQQKSQLHQQIVNDRVELSREKSQHRKLKMNVKQLHNKGYLEQLIRQRYFYHKPGETVYSLPGDVARDVTHK